MANCLPYAIAAQAAYPKRQVIAFVGDGAFSMLMGEFATAVQHKLPVKVIVLKNNSLGMIRWEQLAMLGNPEYACDLSPIDFAKVASACGGDGFSCDDPAEFGNRLDAALASLGPAEADTEFDPAEAPSPPYAPAHESPPPAHPPGLPFTQ